MDRNNAVGRVESDVNGTGIASGASGGLEESGDESAGGRDLVEVGPGEVLKEDVVAEDVREVGRREVVAREEVGGGREVGVRDGEESDGGALEDVGGDGGGGDEGSEGREVREGGEEGGDVDG